VCAFARVCQFCILFMVLPVSAECQGVCKTTVLLACLDLNFALLYSAFSL